MTVTDTMGGSSEPMKYTEPFYVLVVGNDTRIGTIEAEEESYADGSARSDTVMLVRVDPVNYVLSIVSIPRDTAIEVDGEMTKFNVAYQFWGIDGTIQEVEKLTGVKPMYYLDMTFVQYENFVNQLGGVDVNVPADMSLEDIVSGGEISLSAGDQHLNGAEALVLARVRKIYLENLDAVRQGNDRALVAAGIMMVANNPALAVSACEILVENSHTNWNVADLTPLVQDFAAHADQITIMSGTGPYEGDSSSGLWLAYRDEETWHRIIEVMDAGGDPTSVLPTPELKV